MIKDLPVTTGQSVLSSTFLSELFPEERRELANSCSPCFGKGSGNHNLILTRTILGRYTFALGSNEEATRLSGVNVAVWKTSVYMLCGLFAGIAGVLMASRLNSAQPALGAGYELDSIAAVVIGGTSLSGGTGSGAGTLVGILTIGVINNSMGLNNVDANLQLILKGLIIVAAVWLQRRHGP